MVWIVFLTCIHVKDKVIGKTDTVGFANFNTVFT